MSKLGYIHKSFGSSFNVSIANTYGYNVLSGSNLPENSLIVASAIDENNDDVGSYSLLVTDYLGNPIRLTYTLKEGNGIIYSEDSLKINIDNSTIVENSNKELSVNFKELIDNNTIKYDDEGYMFIDYNNLDVASPENYGLFKIDENTIKSEEGILYVDTSALNYANESTNTPGTVIGDNNLINSDQGILSLNQNNIVKASEDSFGFIHSNEETIKIENGVASVITENLDKCSNDKPGVIIPDDKTIIVTENGLSVNTAKLDKVSLTGPGVFKYDDNAFEVKDNHLTFKENDKILEDFAAFSNQEENIAKLDEDIRYLLEEYQVAVSKPSILDFHCAQLLTGVLEKPMKRDESINEMATQFVEVVFMVATNCPFRIAIEFENNLDPQFSLHEINYNDVFIYNGNEGLQNVYQTTESKSVPLKFTFIGKNYYNADKSDYSSKIKIRIVVSYANDGNEFKEILYSIIRYNSGYYKGIEYDDTNIENVLTSTTTL